MFEQIYPPRLLARDASALARIGKVFFCVGLLSFFSGTDSLFYLCIVSWSILDIVERHQQESPTDLKLLAH